MLGPDKGVFRPDVAQVGMYGLVAAEDQMIAVVDQPIDGTIDKRSASPTSPRCRFVKDYLAITPDELYGTCKTGHAGTDDMDLGAYHPKGP